MIERTWCVFREKLITTMSALDALMLRIRMAYIYGEGAIPITMQSLSEFAAARRKQSATVPWPFVSQFIVGPAHTPPLPDWRRVAIGERLKLTAHPALTITQARDGERELTLLGNVLDPINPEATNADILRALLAHRTRASLLEASERYGGRWLLIASYGDEAFLFPDALGLRQAFYTDPTHTGKVWVMSQPGIGEDLLRLAPDEQTLGYIDTQTFRCTHEHRWPGAASPFKGLKHLLPNHWLDLSTGRSHRYWPAAPLAPLSVDAAVERLMVLMPGLVRAASARYDVVLSLTAGIDSRMVLAAARGVIDRMRVMSLRQGRQPDQHPDIEVPARLLGRLGITHDVVRAPATMSPEFALNYKRNAHQAHDHYGHDAEALVTRYARSYAVITGSGAEVARSPFRDKLPYQKNIQLTPETLAWLEYGSVHPFLVSHFADWLRNAQQPYVKLLDLFEWEQGSTWLSMVQLEFDVAWQEIFTPYNCRAVLNTFLAVSERYRSQTSAKLCHAFIERAWPELLSEPINPHKRSGRIKETWKELKAIGKYWAFQRRLRARPVTVSIKTQRPGEAGPLIPLR